MLAADLEIKGLLAQDVPIEKRDAGRTLIAGALRQLSLGEQMMQVRPNLFELELIGRTMIKLTQTDDCGLIGLDGTGRELPQFHFTNHALT